MRAQTGFRLTLPHVLLLLEDKHVMVEELLELLIAEVDAHLLETVVVEDLEAGDVEDTDKGDPEKKRWK